MGGSVFVADERGRKAKARALRPTSTIARSCAGRLIIVAHTKGLGSNDFAGAPTRSRFRPSSPSMKMYELHWSSE
jgi:hypothetical protein